MEKAVLKNMPFVDQAIIIVKMGHILQTAVVIKLMMRIDVTVFKKLNC